MKLDYTGNQRGEVVTGVMVVIMCVMMLFGGMSMMHGGHRHAADQDGRVEEKHDHQQEGMHHPQNNNEGYHSAHDEETESQK
jgi:ABC-type nickel/cobalt efflux system permease component RcnA